MAPITSHVLGCVPPGGNQFRATENVNISRMPMKKVGREKVVRLVVTQKLSREEPRFREIMIPTTVPIMIANTVEVPSKRRVFASFPVLIISNVTSWLLAYENPNRNVNIALM